MQVHAYRGETVSAVLSLRFQLGQHRRAEAAQTAAAPRDRPPVSALRQILLQEIGHAEAHGCSLAGLGAQTRVPVPALQFAFHHRRCQNSKLINKDNQ